MKKFGFGKKSEGDDDDRKRGGLFGRKKPAAQDDNPYAQQPAEDPYARMTPYQQARANIAAGPQAPRPGAADLPSGPRPGGGGLPNGPAQRNGYGTPPPSYQGSPQVGGGYAPDKFGAAGGYGGNRYDTGDSAYGSAGPTSALPSQRFQSRGPGGYGGLGPADKEDNRDELLAGAPQRQPPPPSYASTDNNNSGTSGATGNSYGGGYGEQRELTEEELEKQEYRNIKNQISDTLDQSNNSLDNSLQRLDDTLETGTGTLARLGRHREMLHNTQRNLDLAANQHRIAEEKTKELDTLNRSMFAVHVSNPFTSKQRLAEKDQRVLQRHEMEREQREGIRRDQFHANQNMEKTFKELSRPVQAKGLISADAAEARSKYSFAQDDSDGEEYVGAVAEKNQAIDYKLVKVSERVEKLRQVAVAQGSEIEEQNTLITDLHDRSDKLDSGVRVTRAHLGRIH
ncbi:hypothetical protein CONLIGDRAFT_627381 [Coniochaeta ligniaria NRRL 30616]|uniref:t-SNARE coiled-coil homology domain-containing protein n=1 Tax=Coniochaeta ligniaria NRRL 30616 TaxID=1408157 RepID=A0A1J7J5A2_9PEZI|nr:hypothetical protein CONLIGDRAFT_627381 [Coniochaeta ligniaria NRRL 30616]